MCFLFNPEEFFGMKGLFFGNPVLLLLLFTLSLGVYGESFNIPEDFSTIQAALDASAAGDEIIVFPGIYSENLFISADIVLRSREPENPDCVALTVIDGGRKGSCITLSSTMSDSALINGLTLTNGYSRIGAGIVSDGPHSFGEIGSTAAIRNCRVVNNEAIRSGGGIGNCDGLIENCVVSGNTCGEAGAGIWHCDGVIRNNLIENNISANQGGGFCGCGAEILNNRILNNSAVNQGGGINKSSGENSRIEDNTIQGNTADYGAGVCDSSRADIGENEISGNISREHDGEIWDFKNR